nr:PSP chimeric vaccine protein [synthetic construct]
MKKLTFSSSSKLELISHEAFANLSNLEKLTLPKSVKTLGSNLFRLTTSLNMLMLRGMIVASVAEAAAKEAAAKEAAAKEAAAKAPDNLIKIEEEESNESEAGTVLKQSLPEGTTYDLSKATQIVLTVAKKATTIQLGNYIGRNSTEVISELKQKKVPENLIKIEEEESSESEPGTIMKQSPGAGAEAAAKEAAAKEAAAKEAAAKARADGLNPTPGQVLPEETSGTKEGDLSEKPGDTVLTQAKPEGVTGNTNSLPTPTERTEVSEETSPSSLDTLFEKDEEAQKNPELTDVLKETVDTADVDGTQASPAETTPEQVKGGVKENTKAEAAAKEAAAKEAAAKEAAAKAPSSEVIKETKVGSIIQQNNIKYKVLTVEGNIGTVQVGNGVTPVEFEAGQDGKPFTIPTKITVGDKVFTVTEVASQAFSYYPHHHHHH